MSKEPEFTKEELETIDWLVTFVRPSVTREEAAKHVLAMRTQLWTDLSKEDFSTTEWDYGYGGESHSHPATNYDKLYEWIIEREKRLLLGMTLEEFAKEDWRIE